MIIMETINSGMKIASICVRCIDILKKSLIKIIEQIQYKLTRSCHETAQTLRRVYLAGWVRSGYAGPCGHKVGLTQAEVTRLGRQNLWIQATSSVLPSACFGTPGLTAAAKAAGASASPDHGPEPRVLQARLSLLLGARRRVVGGRPDLLCHSPVACGPPSAPTNGNRLFTAHHPSLGPEEPAVGSRAPHPKL